MAARIALAVLAVALVAGFAVQIHAHNLLTASQDQVKRELTGKTTAAAHQKGLDDALRLADLQPGTSGLFVGIGLDVRAKKLADAERLALRATKREPDNFATWLTLGVIRQDRGDTAGARAAYARVKTLNPLYRTPAL